MTAEIKCVYEGGFLKPLEFFKPRKTSKIIVRIVDKPKKALTKMLKEGYLKTAEDSLKITNEWVHLEEESSKAL